MLLDLEEVEFKVGRTQVLRGIDLQVASGEIAGLLGRNGSGKSSIVKTIIGLYRPSQGKIRFQGMEITNSPPRERVALGLAYSPEDTRIFPDLTVEENIAIGEWVLEDLKKEKKWSMDKTLEVFPAIGKFLKRKGSQLSGGEKKMVSIARALALSPQLLLLDESFEGLAPLVVRHFTEAMLKIKELGVSILLAESNLRNASLVVERAYVVERGEIIFHGSPDKIKEDERLMMIVGR